ncbi:MAG: hypothetical protein FWB94_09940, partial [Chitinispirillia bacterium]|nr:hypothetical protein [Chitinispirillia bacterium]
MRHNKRNKHIAIFIIILMFTIFFGCNILERIVFGNTYKQYHGNYPELYSVAINSILGTRGFA